MKVYELLAKPESWIQHHVALSADRQATRAGSPEAVCWCLVGALTRCYGMEGFWDLRDLRDRVRLEIGEQAIASWNDDPTRTHADVLALARKLDI